MHEMHGMPMHEATVVLSALQAADVDFCLGGGWGVDALLDEQTREHSDLDFWVPASQLHELLLVMVEVGVDRVCPTPGDRPWNWVLHDGNRRIDLHLYEPTDHGYWCYGSSLGGEQFPDEALSGSGVVGGIPVRCESAEWAIKFRTGYALREIDRHDVRLLCERFGLEMPDSYR